MLYLTSFTISAAQAQPASSASSAEYAAALSAKPSVSGQQAHAERLGVCKMLRDHYAPWTVNAMPRTASSASGIATHTRAIAASSGGNGAASLN